MEHPLHHKQAGERIRVMVVDDSLIARRLVSEALDSDPQLEVVGTASNGALALQRIPELHPDVVTLDVEMPELDGLETVKRIRQRHPSVCVIMLSGHTERGAAVTLDALSNGANDYVTKAVAGSNTRTWPQVRNELLIKIKQFFPPPAAARRPELAGRITTALPAKAARIVLIGVSTGGPSALGDVLWKLPPDFPLPVLVVQHMPSVFTRLLAERLQKGCKLKVKEAASGELVAPGKVLIAPGDFHMVLRGTPERPLVELNQDPPENSCRPAVDPLFRSAARLFGGAAMAVVLTGMGQDGLKGAGLLRAKGASVLVQDESSSVVWGMPGAIANAGLADAIVPLPRIAGEILRRVQR